MVAKFIQSCSSDPCCFLSKFHEIKSHLLLCNTDKEDFYHKTCKIQNPRGFRAATNMKEDLINLQM